MRFKLIPKEREFSLSASLSGDVVTLNGRDYDFGPLADGAVLPPDAIDSDWIVGDVTRKDGEVELTLIVPWAAPAPEQTRFPEPIEMTADGSVPLPPYTEPSDSEEGT